MKIIKSILALSLILSIPIFHSCRNENTDSVLPSDPTNNDLFLLPSHELIKRIKEDQSLEHVIMRDGGGGEGSISKQIDCDAQPDCTTGVELLQIFPQTPAFKFRIDLARADINVTTSEAFYNLQQGEFCEYVILAYPLAYANQLIQTGLENVIPIASPGAAYMLPYYENESIFMFGLLDTDGSGNPGCEPHVDIRLYHRFGWDCFEIHDAWCDFPQSILDNTLRWETTDCNDEAPPRSGNIFCPL